MARERRKKRAGGSAARRGVEALAAMPRGDVPVGGRFRPLSDGNLRRIYGFALDILEKVGLAEPTPAILSAVDSRGGAVGSGGRLRLPRALVEDVIARCARPVRLPGFAEDRGIDLADRQVHFGTGGAAVQVLDGSTGRFRDSTLADLFALMRVVDACEHISYGLRPVVSRDMPCDRTLDINTAYAGLRATTKPIGTSFTTAAHVPEVVAMFDMALGGEDRFRAQPFCFAAICHVVPPLRFAADACGVLEACVAEGVPVQLCSAGQAGATSPAALAAALGQGLAESLAGLVVTELLSPGHPCILAFMPFISDLRTGAMTGGAGECAVANAAAAQLLGWLGLPSTVSAGMTDAKLPDNQAGAEKAHGAALAAQAGANMINLSCGMLGSIMAASCEALVMDDDMCGAILRGVRGVEVRPDSLDLALIEETVGGPGHYLGQGQTLALMKTEYLYPQLSDRRSIADWLDQGQDTLWDRARRRVDAILSEDLPVHIDAATDRRIREAFPIRLDIAAPVPGKEAAL